MIGYDENQFDYGTDFPVHGMNELDNGNVPAQFVSRGHYHTFVKETLYMEYAGQEIESTLIINPSLCMLNNHARQATKSSFIITNGFINVEIINGKIHNVIKLTKTLDIRTKEIL